MHGEDGQVVEKDRVESMFLPNTAGGGRFGLLIATIGGPLGMLIGAVGGLCPRVAVRPGRHRRDGVGAGRDLDQRLGRAYRIAGVCERAESRGDRRGHVDVGGTVLRRFVTDVEAEIAAAEDAERKAKWEARKELASSHREHDTAAVDVKLDELKAKLSRGQKARA